MNQSPAFRVALRAAFAALALGLSSQISTASAQVLGSAPYAPAPDPVLERMQSRVDTLENELRKTTGRIEQLGFQLNQANQTITKANDRNAQLEAQLQAMTARIDALEALARGDIDELSQAITEPTERYVALTPGTTSGPAPAPEAIASRVDVSTLPTDETELLKESRELLLSGNYPAAQQALSHYLQQHPKSANADSAQYLLGESLLYQENYADGATAYGTLLSAYPKSERGPEALVKLSRSMRLMGKKAEACQALGLMSGQFPNASQTAKTLAASEKSRAGC